MKISNIPTAFLRLDKRNKLKKTEKYPIFLELYFDGKKKRLRVPISCTEKEWDRVNATRVKDEDMKALKSELTAYENKANEIIKALGDDFCFEAFEILYLGEKKKKRNNHDDPEQEKKENVYDGFQKRIDRARAEESFNTASLYTCALNSWRKFSPNLEYKDITVSFLKKYENHAIVKLKMSPTTVNMYMRCIKAVMNEAIADKIISAELYPFGSPKAKKYQAPSSRNIKKALDEAEIKAIIQYEPRTANEARARDLWLFSFYCNGMNLIDIFNLKYRDIGNEFMYFIRLKTKRTTKKQEPVEVYLSAPAREIIRRWGNANNNPNNYVFKMIDDKLSAEANFKRCQSYLRLLNRYMRRIGERLGIKSSSMSTYVARHSWGTTLMRKGISTAFISKGYGHTSIQTTENYLGHFSQDQKKSAAELISSLAQTDLETNEPHKTA